MKINKMILVPVISSILVFIKESCGYELPDGTADIIATGLLWFIGFIGISMHPKKTKVYDEENMV